MNKRIFKNLYAISFAVQQPLRSFDGTNNDWEIARNYFLESAVINIKKTQGESKSDDKDLHNLSKKNKSLLAEQVALLSPDVVICGGTMRYVANFCDLEKFANNIMRYNDFFFFDLYHPSYIKEDEYNHIGFVQELMSQLPT
jgi:uracil-DNA glycosylase